MTAICKKCLVELDEEMKLCPLCGTPLNVDDEITQDNDLPDFVRNLKDNEKYLMHRVLWQTTATLLFSGILATVIIDIVNNKRITWSIYPTSICLILLSYVLPFAFWNTTLIYRILTGWILSSLLMVIVGQLFPATGWTLGLGIPLLFALNLIFLSLVGLFRITKRKGLNLLAYSFVAIAVLCMGIEGIISLYVAGSIQLRWSIIVAACLLPVTAVLIFMFFRTLNNPTIQKIFHT